MLGQFKREGIIEDIDLEIRMIATDVRAGGEYVDAAGLVFLEFEIDKQSRGATATRVESTRSSKFDDILEFEKLEFFKGHHVRVGDSMYIKIITTPHTNLYPYKFSANVVWR